MKDIEENKSETKKALATFKRNRVGNICLSKTIDKPLNKKKKLSILNNGHKFN